MDELVFTPSAILDLLTSIDELNEYDISVQEELNGDIEIQIGSSVYHINTDQSEQLRVSSSVLETIDEINSDTYDELVSRDLVQYTPIESGIISEIGKTLLVGGLVRLTDKLLRK